MNILSRKSKLRYKKEHLEDAFDFSDNTVSIIGSCVSRDLLEYHKSHNFVLKNYYARSSIVSAVSKPIFISEERIGLESKFQKRQVMNDFSKNMWYVLEHNKSDYLILDFIDERFALGKIGQSYFTLSAEFMLSHALNEEEYERIERIKKNKKYYVDSVDLDEYIKSFCNLIIERFKPECIILHKARMADYYLTKNGRVKRFSKSDICFNHKVNELLDYMYDAICTRISGIKVVEASEYCLANEDHQWGLSPMHYQDNYYITILNKIGEMISCNHHKTSKRIDVVTSIPKKKVTLTGDYESIEYNTSLFQEYEVYCPFKTTFKIEQELYDEKRICDRFLEHELVLHTKVVKNLKQDYSFTSFGDIIQKYDATEQLQFYNLGIIHYLLSVIKKTNNPDYTQVLSKYLKGFLEYAKISFDELDSLPYSTYDRIYCLLEYVCSDLADSELRKEVIEHLYREYKNIDYKKNIALGMFTYLKKISADAILAAFFLDEAGMEMLVHPVNKFIDNCMNADGLDCYRSPATSVNTMQYLKQICSMLQKFGIKDEKLIGITRNGQKALSMLSDNNGFFVNIDHTMMLKSTYGTEEQYSFTNNNMIVYKNPDIYCLLRSQSKKDLSHHSDIGEVIFQYKGKNVLIDPGTKGDTYAYHSCAYFEKYENLAPKKVTEELLSCNASINKTDTTFSMIHNAYFIDGEIERRVEYDSNLFISDKFTTNEMAGISRFMFSPECDEFSLNENQLQFKIEDMAGKVTVTPKEAELSIEKIVIDNRTYTSLVVHISANHTITTRISFEQLQMKLEKSCTQLDERLSRQIDRIIDNEITNYLVSLESFGAVELYRYGKKAYLQGDYNTSKKCEYLNKLLHNCHIKSTCNIGLGTRNAYGGIGVLIHAASNIGEYCNIGTGVTIASACNLKDYVYIATGAKIVGNSITIGSFSIVGANAVVKDNIPPFSIVAGVPAKIVKQITPDNVERYLRSYLISVEKNNEELVNEARIRFMKLYEEINMK